MMAEAAVDNPTTSTPKYFCHKCSMSVEISPNVPDLICPKCDSGFIEELTQELEASQQQARDERPSRLKENQTENHITAGAAIANRFSFRYMSSILSNVLLNVTGSHDSTLDGDDDLDDEEDNTSDEEYRRHVAHTVHTFSSMTRHPRRRGARPARPFITSRGLGRNDSVPRFLENLFVSLTGGSSSGGESSDFPHIFQHGLLNGDPRDYAWGSDGLDNIITQLLNQMEGSGPPPATEQEIETLCSIRIEQDHIDHAAQCSVCMEMFELDDVVTQLTCHHLYHRDCIVPWLKQHGTCPICRQSLSSTTTLEGEGKPLPMSRNATSSSSSSNDGFADLHPMTTQQQNQIDTSSNDADTNWEDPIEDRWFFTGTTVQNSTPNNDANWNDSLINNCERRLDIRDTNNRDETDDSDDN